MADAPNLTPEQMADAARLMATFQNWKADERAQGRRATQEDVAHALGISQSAFSQFCRGVRAINADLLSKAHKSFGWNPIEISPSLAKKMAGFAEAAGVSDDGEHSAVHLVDAAASAGRGGLVYSDDIRKDLMFRRDWLRSKGAKPGETLAFPVKGDSMIDAHIPDGSVVLANKAQTDLVSGRIYVIWANGELFVKEMVPDGDAWIARSKNSARPEDFPDIQIDDPNGRIVGRVFWCGFEL